MGTNPYEVLFAHHRSAAVPSLWPWQSEVLAAHAGTNGDAAVELPTGTGKTLIGLLAGEHFRQGGGGPVAFLAGNKQLAQQVERQARDLGFPVVRFQGPKDGWVQRDVRQFNYGQAIGVMNYWNYFNAAPGVEPGDFQPPSLFQRSRNVVSLWKIAPLISMSRIMAGVIVSVTPSSCSSS